jgi:hypothetical protein
LPELNIQQDNVKITRYNELAMEYLKYRHVVNLGDLISSLPGMKRLYEETGKKAFIYQQLNRPGEYYVGATHPTTDATGAMVCFNEEMFAMMRPLLLSQEYIAQFEVYNGQQVDYDLDVVRLQTYCGAPNFPLHKWLWMAYPEMSCDLSKSWLDIHPLNCICYHKPGGEINWWQAKVGEKHNRIIINFTDRYRNFNINYYFLKQFEKDLVFAGTDTEYTGFCNKWGLSIPKLAVEDFHALAGAIKGCRFFLGNQSFAWHLAQAMHVPRILELYPFAQNCTNFGADGYEFYHQPALEYYVNKLYNE